MSILRESGRQQRLCCDVCGEEGDEFDQARFNQMIEAAKSDGWSITKSGAEWEHRCPDHADIIAESPLARARRLFPNHASRLGHK